MKTLVALLFFVAAAVCNAADGPVVHEQEGTVFVFAATADGEVKAYRLQWVCLDGTPTEVKVALFAQKASQCPPKSGANPTLQPVSTFSEMLNDVRTKKAKP
jgi:hypothetical protein